MLPVPSAGKHVCQLVPSAGKHVCQLVPSAGKAAIYIATRGKTCVVNQCQTQENITGARRGKTYKLKKEKNKTKTTCNYCQTYHPWRGNSVASAKRGKTCLLTSAMREKKRNMHFYAPTSAKRGKTYKKKHFPRNPCQVCENVQTIASAKRGKTRIMTIYFPEMKENYIYTIWVKKLLFGSAKTRRFQGKNIHG